jgi:hypothetical protein
MEMEVDTDFDRKKGLYNLTDDQLIMFFTVLGGIGFILGFLIIFLGGIGLFVMWTALMVSRPYWRHRNESDWSRKVMAQAYALSAFGGMAVLGSSLRIVIEILT